jgi:hypothetical protein
MKIITTIKDFLSEEQYENFNKKLPEINAAQNFIWGSTTVQAVAFLLQFCKGKSFFEFGTFDGQTTAMISKYADIVYTIDLDNYDELINQEDNAKNYVKVETGHAYMESGSKNIIQLYGDSTKYDFSKINKIFDLVFIDGGHTYECCSADLKNTHEYLIDKDSDYMIVIDDACGYWPGVKKALDEWSEKCDVYYFRDFNGFAVIKNF